MTNVEEYHALRGGRGFVELVGWSSVTVTGADRQAFLNNFCTNDVKRLTPGESCEAFFTNVKGRIIGHGLVDCRDDAVVIIGVPRQAPRLIEHLDRYVIREDVQLRDTTAERAYLLVVGSGDRISDCGLTSASSVEPRIADWNSGGDDLRLIEIESGEWTSVSSLLVARGFVACGSSAFEMLRIEAGMPLFGVDFDERNFPQEVGRDQQAISFTKGCYLGQETVARIDALGHVNQRIVGVKFSGETIPSAGDALTFGGTDAGRVTSATFSPRLAAPLALAMVRREHAAADARLESGAGPCEVVELPLDARQ